MPSQPMRLMPGYVRALNGRQIFIDDINQSNGANKLSLAYSPPFFVSGQVDDGIHHQSTDTIPPIIRTSIENSTEKITSWNETDLDEDYRNSFWPFSIDMQHLVFVAMCLCLVTLVLIILIVLRLRHIYLRWRRRRRSGPRIAIIEAQAGANSHTPQLNNGRRGLLSRMLARIEEFDSLTPLIITPSSLSDDDHLPMLATSAVRQSIDRVSTTTNNSTPISLRGSPRRRPRGMSGRMTLFPLASNARRAEPYIVAEVASDSGDSIRGNAGTNHTYTRVQTAINGVVMRNPFEDLDLVSIDRTSGASTLDRRNTPNDLLSAAPQDANAAALVLANRQPPQYLQSTQHHLPAGMVATSSGIDAYPLSTLPSPASTDVLIPASELRSSVQNLNHQNSAASNNNKNHRASSGNGNNHYRFVIKRESSSVDSLNSNLSSPMDSSVCGDTGSPLDTTGSLAELSDSVYMASESENSDAARTAGRIYSVDTGTSQRWYTVSAPGASGSGSGDGSDRSEPDLSTFEFDTPAMKRYVLHRIEEESVDEIAAGGTTANSSTPGDRSKRSANGQRSTSSKGDKHPQSQQTYLGI